VHFYDLKGLVGRARKLFFYPGDVVRMSVHQVRVYLQNYMVPQPVTVTFSGFHQHVAKNKLKNPKT